MDKHDVYRMITFNRLCNVLKVNPSGKKKTAYGAKRMPKQKRGERGGSVVECRTPEREIRGLKPTAAVLCPWARHFTPRKYWLITQEAMAPSRHDWKIVDWDVKPQHNQPKQKTLSNSNSISILGIPITYTLHNGKSNICAFHEEIHAFEDWIFVRLSSLVLPCEWTTNRKRWQFNQSISIDLWRQKVATPWFCPLRGSL